MAARHPDRVSATIGFDERLAHLIEAGADIFLMPSRFEPCGLNQLYSLRYGTVPVVRATGGLQDTVIDASEPDGNGFKFSDYSPGCAGCSSTAGGRDLCRQGRVGQRSSARVWRGTPPGTFQPGSMSKCIGRQESQ